MDDLDDIDERFHRFTLAEVITERYGESGDFVVLLEPVTVRKRARSAELLKIGRPTAGLSNVGTSLRRHPAIKVSDRRSFALDGGGIADLQSSEQILLNHLLSNNTARFLDLPAQIPAL